MKQLLEICEHLSIIVGIQCKLLDVLEQHFYPKSTLEDTMLPAHCKNCAEALRRNNISCYETSKGHHFLAIPIQPPNLGIIIGPFTVGNTEKLQSICALAKIIGKGMKQKNHMSEPDSLLQKEALHTIGIYTKNSIYVSNSVRYKRQLVRLIQAGDKKGAQKLLNTILLQLYMAAGTDLLQLKACAREIIMLMSYAAADNDIDKIICDEGLNKITQAKDFDELDILLSELLHQFVSLAFQYNNTKHQYVVRQIVNYVEQNLTEKISLKKAADSIPISKSYLCRILKQEWGCTFTEYVNKLRVERSKYLLQTSDGTLAQIASMAGFEDQSYFSRVFKRYVGQTPGKYRANIYHIKG